MVCFFRFLVFFEISHGWPLHDVTSDFVYVANGLVSFSRKRGKRYEIFTLLQDIKFTIVFSRIGSDLKVCPQLAF
jgi:hypothetical protein